jgi:hypothetical protein
LHRHGIHKEVVFVYVADQEQHDLYSTTLNKEYYGQLIVGVKGLVQQREFIMASFPKGQAIVFADDDLDDIYFAETSVYRGNPLHSFLESAFATSIKIGAFLWGVYPVDNPYFMKGEREYTTALRLIVGAFYGIVNRPGCADLKLVLTRDDSHKEDTERSLQHFLKDGVVLRFDKVGIKTKYYGKIGGMGQFHERVEPSRKATERLVGVYPQYGVLKVRKNGMVEFALKRGKK